MDELIAKRERFLAFLIGKVRDRALAEDLLQDAFARLQNLAEVRDPEAFFYRMLRNAVIDRARRERTRAIALEAFAHQLPDEELDTCRCVSALKDKLKPDYRTALQRIEVDGIAVKDYAQEAGISAGSAAVRVYRARNELRERVTETCGACATAGCLDCTCG